MEGIWIGIMSANNGAGSTALAIGLANYINQYDASVCYVEANESGDLAAMAEYYGFDKTEDEHYVKNGMDYWHQSIDQTKKYVVIDFGKYGANKLKIYEQCAIKIMITDSKPYRMIDALNVYRYIGDEQTLFCLNYGNAETYQQIREQYLMEVSQVFGLENHMDLFDITDPFYREIMKDHLHIEEEPRLAFIVQPDRWKDWLKKRKNSKQQNQDVTENISDTIQAPIEAEEQDMPELEEDPEEIPEIEKDKEDPTEESVLIEEQENETCVDEVNLEDVSMEQAEKRKKYVKTFLGILAITGVGSISFLAATYHRSLFSFTNQTGVTEASTAVDEDLNINPDIKISVLEVDGADGYEVSYSTDQSFPEERTVVVEVETADKAVESLAADKTYYVRVRAFKFKEDGTKVYGEYTDVQKIRT